MFENLNSKWKRSLFILAIVLAALMAYLIVSFTNYIERSTYAERQTSLKNITESSASVINKVFKTYEYAAYNVKLSAEKELQQNEDPFAVLEDIKENIGIEGMEIAFVDKSGILYLDDGSLGKVTEMEAYNSSSDDLEVYFCEDAGGKYYITFRNRFEKVQNAVIDGENAEFEYCAVRMPLDTLDMELIRDLGENTNTFVVDEEGYFLYTRTMAKGDGTMIIPGNNAFVKLEKITTVHGEDAADVRKSVENGETVAIEFESGGENYFYCSSPIEYNNWKLNYIVRSDEVASGSYIKSVTRYISAMAVIFGLAVLGFLVLYIVADNNRKVIKLQKENNKLLEEVSRSKSEFLSNMSHDIRTPLNGIMGMTAIALKENENNPRVEDCLNKINKSSAHLLSLVNDVLDMSRIESGKVQIVNKPTNLIELLDDCTNIISSSAKDNGLEFTSDFSLIEHKGVMCDALHIKQILINILGNAVKYTPKGGKVALRVFELEYDDNRSEYMFEVEDNGIGMKKEFIPHIFDSFSQDEGARNSQHKSTGLGMSITKKLADLMDGKIDVESELGVGSKFTVHIPLETVELAEEEKEEAEKEISIKGVKILLVEDNELNAEIATEILTEAGAEITLAVNGKEALDNFTTSAQGTYDMILMDCMMPVMDGITATREIRNYPREDCRTVPIIAMTANAFAEDVEKVLAAGMNAHLSKPINVKEMMKVIHQYM